MEPKVGHVGACIFDYDHYGLKAPLSLYTRHATFNQQNLCRALNTMNQKGDDTRKED